MANKNLEINLKIDHEVKNKKQLLDDSLIDNNFKQVEDSLMNLSTLLSSLYLSTLSVSSTSNISCNQQLNMQQQLNQLHQSGSTSQFSQHQQQPSISVKYKKKDLAYNSK